MFVCTKLCKLDVIHKKTNCFPEGACWALHVSNEQNSACCEFCHFALLNMKSQAFLPKCVKYRRKKKQIHRLSSWKLIYQVKSTQRWLLLFGWGGCIGEMKEYVKKVCLPLVLIHLEWQKKKNKHTEIKHCWLSYRLKSQEGAMQYTPWRNVFYLCIFMYLGHSSILSCCFPEGEFHVHYPKSWKSCTFKTHWMRPSATFLWFSGLWLPESYRSDWL